jgi:hypothetical protein
MLDCCLNVTNFQQLDVKMNDLSITMYEEFDSQEQELMRFECWYHSVIDDMAGLIRANGYDKVMFDVMCAVRRMQKDVE